MEAEQKPSHAQEAQWVLLSFRTIFARYNKSPTIEPSTYKVSNMGMCPYMSSQVRRE